MKRLIALLFAALMILSCISPALAAQSVKYTNFTVSDEEKTYDPTYVKNHTMLTTRPLNLRDAPSGKVLTVIPMNTYLINLGNAPKGYVRVRYGSVTGICALRWLIKVKGAGYDPKYYGIEDLTVLWGDRKKTFVQTILLPGYFVTEVGKATSSLRSVWYNGSYGFVDKKSIKRLDIAEGTQPKTMSSTKRKIQIYKLNTGKRKLKIHKGSTLTVYKLADGNDEFLGCCYCDPVTKKRGLGKIRNTGEYN